MPISPEGIAAACLEKVRASKLASRADRAAVADAVSSFVNERRAAGDNRSAVDLHIAATEHHLAQNRARRMEILDKAGIANDQAGTAEAGAVESGDTGERTSPLATGEGISGGTEPGPEGADVDEQTTSVTGISKAAISEQREARNLPEIERAKQGDFGEYNDIANEIVAKDALAPSKLITELEENPRPLRKHEAPLLVRRMQEAQRDYNLADDAANRDLNDKEAHARFEAAKAEYDRVTKVVQDTTGETGAASIPLNCS
jgi:hypothetical protein